MATQNTNRGYHSEHPFSRVVDKDDPAATLFNVANLLSMLKEADLDDSTDVARRGINVLLQKCINAVSFEAVRMEVQS